MSSHSVFTLFALLPTELRLEIWRLSCHPRVVDVSYDAEDDRCVTTSSVPAVLQTCHESRTECLRLYVKCFGTMSHEPRIYFYREMDTLYIPRPPSMGYDDTSRSFAELIRDVDDIANLAIDYVPPSIKRPWETYNKYVLMQSFPKVHEVFLVTDTADGTPQHSHHVGELDLKDSTCDAVSMGRLLDDVMASFYYEVRGTFEISEMAERTAAMEQLHLPHLVLKSKTWTHPQDENSPVHAISVA